MGEHNTLVGSQCHEPKGADTATANQVYVADGSGSGTWTDITTDILTSGVIVPHGGCYYNDIGTGTTFTAPAAYTLMNVATTATTGASNFTHNSLNRLTYSGTGTRHTHGVVDISFKHSTGSGQDCYFAAYKNGVILPGSEVVQSADSANYQKIALHFDCHTTTSDYLEIYLKVASGNIIVHASYLFIMGMPG